MSALKSILVFALCIALIGNGVVWAEPIMESHEIDHSGVLHQSSGAGDDLDLTCNHCCNGGAHNTCIASPELIFSPQGREEAPAWFQWTLITTLLVWATPPPLPA